MNTEFEDDIVNCLHVLQTGGIILYPTDTIWGVGCDATNTMAIKKIYSLKKRDETKSMIVLVAEKEDILQYVATPDSVVFDFINAQTRPTTMVFENAIGLPQNLIAEDGSVALRVVKDAFCKELIKRSGKPLVSTSANISGADSPQNFKDIATEIFNGVDYTVHYRRKEMTAAKPSQIIKWNENGSYVVIRK